MFFISKKQTLLITLLIFIISLISVFDLFTTSARPATMDGRIHVTTIAQFTHAIKIGDVPVLWLDGFANYGHPLGLIAHQFPTYLGALFNLVLTNPVLAFNVTTFFGIFLANIFFYRFLRLYFPSLYSLLGVFLISFAPYRILNVYIRGAIPETISSIFVPLVFIGIYYLFHKKYIFSFFLLVLSVSGLMLTHPMMLVTYSFLFLPYFIYTYSNYLAKKSKFSFSILQPSIFMIGISILSLGIASYYLLPLMLEMKYFYYGFETNHLKPQQFMGISNYVSSSWYYFYQNDVLTRGHVIQAGLIETLSIVTAFGFVIVTRVIKRAKTPMTILEWALFSSIVIIFFTSDYANPIYQMLPLLGSIQFPWRLFSAFIFLPPLILVYFISKLQKPYPVFGLILLIAFLRFPQLYGKNYVAFPLSTYDFTSVNLHSNNMNTIWTDRTDRYPVKPEKIELVEGKGKIHDKTISNSWRKYSIEAKTPVRLVDYTFYFPGWHVYVDGVDTPIQFQDPDYRGVITYEVPQGNHEVKLKFEDTKIRLLGKIISIFSLGILGALFLFRKKLFSYLSF